MMHIYTYFLFYDFLHPDTTTINGIVLGFFSLACYVLHKPCFGGWRVTQMKICLCPGETRDVFSFVQRVCAYALRSLARSICIQLARWKLSPHLNNSIESNRISQWSNESGHTPPCASCCVRTVNSFCGMFSFSFYVFFVFRIFHSKYESHE